MRDPRASSSGRYAQQGSLCPVTHRQANVTDRVISTSEQHLRQDAENHLLYVHVHITRQFAGVEAHHSGFDSDGWLAVGGGRRHSGFFIAAEAALQTSSWHAAIRSAGGLVRTEQVEAVLTGARFPHVFCKVAAR